MIGDAIWKKWVYRFHPVGRRAKCITYLERAEKLKEYIKVGYIVVKLLQFADASWVSVLSIVTYEIHVARVERGNQWKREQTATQTRKMTRYTSHKTSVADPWYFGTDPDPRILLFSSMTFKTTPKKWEKKIFPLVFLLITFWSYIYIIFQR